MVYLLENKKKIRRVTVNIENQLRKDAANMQADVGAKDVFLQSHHAVIQLPKNR